MISFTEQMTIKPFADITWTVQDITPNWFDAPTQQIVLRELLAIEQLSTNINEVSGELESLIFAVSNIHNVYAIMTNAKRKRYTLVF